MRYLYGTFTDDQMKTTARQMHSEVHKLLLYKDPNISDKVFATDEEFIHFFENVLVRFGGFNHLLGEPDKMPYLMSSLQAAFDELGKDPFDYHLYRKLLFDVHGYLTEILGEVR